MGQYDGGVINSRDIGMHPVIDFDENHSLHLALLNCVGNMAMLPI